MLATIDNLDDRREIVRLIGELKPGIRFRWLGWVLTYLKMDLEITNYDRLQLAEAARGIESGNKYVTNYTYYNAIMAAVQAGIDLQELVVSLEALARGKLTIDDLAFPEVQNAIRSRVQGFRRQPNGNDTGEHPKPIRAG